MLDFGASRFLASFSTLCPPFFLRQLKEGAAANRPSPQPLHTELVAEPVTVGRADAAKGKQGASFPSLSLLQQPAENVSLREKNLQFHLILE